MYIFIYNIYILRNNNRLFKKLSVRLDTFDHLGISERPFWVLAKREHPEKWYQEKWCEAQKGQVEVVLPDGTRCDCVTDTHAIEFDFGST